MSAADVFNIDAQCKVPHCSIIVLVLVIVVLAAVLVVGWLLIRKFWRNRMRVQATQPPLPQQIQTMLDQQKANVENAIVHTEENLKPELKKRQLSLQEALNLQYSGEGLYKFEEEDVTEEPPTKPSREKKPPSNRYMDELVKQIETETVEIRKISIRRKRKTMIRRKAMFFSQEPTKVPPNDRLDTIQEEIPSILVSSIDVKPTSPMSFSFHLEPTPCEASQ